MNILPHKSWHVRTKANIARVRKDEAKAAEEEKERQRRIELAESEARTAHLREKAKEKFNRHNTHDKKQDDTNIADEDKPIAYPPHEHVNLFRDVEEGTDGFKKTNEDREKEDKETREKYEKSIGYLTYLGQDSQVTSWYQGKRIRDEIDTINEVVVDDESQLKDKLRHDPLTLIQTAVGVQKTSKEITSQTTSVDYCISKQNSKDSEKRKRSVDRKERGKKRKRNDSCSSSSGSSASYSYKRRKSHHKKHKHKNSSKRRKRREQKLIKSSSESDSDEEEKKKQLLKLREERLKREREEKARAEKLLAKLRGEKIPDETVGEEKGENRRRQKYNSQYNPDIAKQNKD